MRLLKLLFISVVLLCIAILFVFSLFPTHIRISRVININTSKEKIQAAIQDCRKWDQWNEFITQMHTVTIISNPSSGKGAFVESGGMRVTIVSNTQDSITTHWTQKDKRQFNGGFNIIQADSGNVVIEWYFNFNFRWYPWEKLGSMFYDKQLGPVMEKSLLNLKSFAENH